MLPEKIDMGSQSDLLFRGQHIRLFLPTPTSWLTIPSFLGDGLGDRGKSVIRASAFITLLFLGSSP